MLPLGLTVIETPGLLRSVRINWPTLVWLHVWTAVASVMGSGGGQGEGLPFLSLSIHLSQCP